jgi:hypothetical protein
VVRGMEMEVKLSTKRRGTLLRSAGWGCLIGDGAARADGLIPTSSKPEAEAEAERAGSGSLTHNYHTGLVYTYLYWRQP